ncbi:MAG: FtsK/SpoIIIE domain-containing protein [Planctomycetaceae bacterium]
MLEFAPLFDDLRAAIQRRIAAEADYRRRFPDGQDELEHQLEHQLKSLSDDREAQLAELEGEFAVRREELRTTCTANRQAVDFAHREALREIERKHNDEAAEIEARFNDSTWVTSSVLDDTSEESPKRKFEKYKTLLHKAREDQIAIWSEFEASYKALADRIGFQGGLPAEPTDPPADRDAAQLRFEAAVEAVEQQQQQVERLWLPKLFTGLRSLWLFIGLAAIVFVPLYLFLPPGAIGVRQASDSPTWLGLVGAAASIVAIIVELLAYTIASMQQGDAMRRVQNSLAEAGWVHQKWLGMAKEELQTRTKDYETRQRDVVRQRDAALKRFESAHAQHRDDIESRREIAVQQEDKRHHEQAQQVARQEQADEARINAEERQRRGEISNAFESAHSRLQEQLGEHSGVRRREQAQAWHALKADWEESFVQFQSAVASIDHAASEDVQDWQSLASQAWTPSTEIPSAIRFGEYAIDLRALAGAIPSDPRLAPAVTDYTLPALLPFPDHSSLLLKYKGAAGRSAAVQIQQTILLRLLTQLPPGKLRLTILDPVGLGESFAGFMHLADFDDKLVTSRIWTESNQIEARLADLTEHMENVFQKYLRNEFSTIEEYNEHAGEVAEPYHFLVLGDFPAKFSDIAAQRLSSIVTSGPRCGVYTLMTADLSQSFPNNFSLADLQEHMQAFAWRDGAFRAIGTELEGGGPAAARIAAQHRVASNLFEDETNGDLSESDDDSTASTAISGSTHYPLIPDEPPPPDQFTAIVKGVGRESKDARRVEVSFGRIAPKADAWWTQDSRREIDVPLGRAGATKLQHARLGKGTSQHMLVAGKTGSGKSTFLHAFITNLALHYSPDEVRFYLIDFKKGVEFKDYAACRLPHADVIAIESDREFGVSALQRLDAVLQARGELFRRHGVQDIAGFRNANPDHPLPRILLVIDEFQEFFIEDDKLSQNASLLLDRLVRQGRAFGIHVVLGSQTLGGAYSLARSTLGQVAVRVALQCSEADAHLILSETNTAARLLSRPGEAIYNDANGMLEGNHPFQIAWLADEDRESYLQQLAELAEQNALEISPPIVFEGNIPSNPTGNAALTTLLKRSYAEQSTSQEGSQSSAIAAPTLWLGEAVEIGPATSLTFEPRAGSHLLLVGADSEAAYGVMANGLLSLTAAGSAAYLLDGSAADAIEAQWWRELCDAAPGEVRRILLRDTAAALTELAAERERREALRASGDEPAPPLFVFIYNISKFRDLRKVDDDYSFGSFGNSAEAKPVEPGKLFTELIAKGAEVGIHLIVWCDSAGNLERWFSRNTLKELECRVAFQMNAADSSNLIDTPAASRLGVNRALLYREETGTVEKFRPYGAPALDWLLGLADKRRAGSTETLSASRPVTPAVPSATTPSMEKPSSKPSEDNLEVATDLDSFSVS